MTPQERRAAVEAELAAALGGTIFTDCRVAPGTFIIGAHGHGARVWGDGPTAPHECLPDAPCDARRTELEAGDG